ncbi:hypothetical protein D8M04_18765 [Oceanobacillus piezotolerans]|uniref:HicA family toxin-antitoxin system n=1 Tax=Oceanobacillus piezotolerans TaxID=2448030 RepID=A0A498D3E1_9BACI|nr:hypothetical protein [Oceanobacillus piezotolerans]RLL40591.1 hypothetical protein D8M04_18765 [Oceanobacillus piezotolerans]
MTKENEEKLEIMNFEFGQILSDHPVHERHEFSFTVDENEFKGHFHEGEIKWMHPYPRQILNEEKEAKIENKIRELLGQHGISNTIHDIEMEQAFEDRPHERRQVTLKVQGHEFKGFVHEGDIHWFHPQPNQKLKEEHVEAIETEILGK